MMSTSFKHQTTLKCRVKVTSIGFKSDGWETLTSKQLPYLKPGERRTTMEKKLVNLFILLQLHYPIEAPLSPSGRTYFKFKRERRTEHKITNF